MARRPVRCRDSVRPAHRLRPDERSRLRGPGRRAARLRRPAPRRLHRRPLRGPDRPGDGLLRGGGLDLVRLDRADQPQPAGRDARSCGVGRQPGDRLAVRSGDRRSDRPGARPIWHRDPRRRPRGPLRPDHHPCRLERRGRAGTTGARTPAKRRRLARRARLHAEPGRSGRRFERTGGAAGHQCAALRRCRSRLAAAERLGRDDAAVHRSLHVPVAAPARLPAGASGVHGRHHRLPRLCRELRAHGRADRRRVVVHQRDARDRDPQGEREPADGARGGRSSGSATATASTPRPA